MRAERGEAWTLVLEVHGRRDIVRARALVNATGPWVGRFNETVLGQPAADDLRLVAGSHIVVPRLFDHDRAYIFQTADGRVVFALPFEGDFTLIGTTDREFCRRSGASVGDGRRDRLSLRHRQRPLSRRRSRPPTWSGRSPACGRSTATSSTKPQDTPRDYVLVVDREVGQAPLLTVYGGKITTYRRLAEEAYDELAPTFGARPAWTGRAALPGGDFAVDGIERLVAETRACWPFLTEAHARRLVRAYGTRVRKNPRRRQQP